MSTTLFLIGINDITFNLKSPKKAQLFAGNITITCSWENVHCINEHLWTAINTPQDWSRTIGLHFSPQKTQSILFTRKNKLQLPPKLHLSDIEIKFADTIKIFLTKSYLERHVLKDSCIKKLNIIKIRFNNNWRADKDTVLETYRALIRSKLDYGSSVYNSVKLHEKNNNRSNLRYSFKTSNRSMPNFRLFEAKEMALETRRKFLTLKYAIKI